MRPEGGRGVTGEPSRETDEVDGILAAWRQVRPDLDVEPLAVLSRVGRLSKYLDRERRRTFAEHGLELFEFDVLSSLRRAGEPFALSPGRLLALTLVTSGTMTNRIDRMVEHGLVERHTDASDRRVVLVRLTALGKTKVDAAMADLLDRERTILAPLTDADRSQLAGQLRSVLARLDDDPR